MAGAQAAMGTLLQRKVAATAAPLLRCAALSAEEREEVQRLLLPGVGDDSSRCAAGCVLLALVHSAWLCRSSDTPAAATPSAPSVAAPAGAAAAEDTAAADTGAAAHEDASEGSTGEAWRASWRGTAAARYMAHAPVQRFLDAAKHATASGAAATQRLQRCAQELVADFCRAWLAVDAAAERAQAEHEVASLIAGACAGETCCAPGARGTPVIRATARALRTHLLHASSSAAAAAAARLVAACRAQDVLLGAHWVCHAACGDDAGKWRDLLGPHCASAAAALGGSLPASRSEAGEGAPRGGALAWHCALARGSAPGSTSDAAAPAAPSRVELRRAVQVLAGDLEACCFLQEALELAAFAGTPLAGAVAAGAESDREQEHGAAGAGAGAGAGDASVNVAQALVTVLLPGWVAEFLQLWAAAAAAGGGGESEEGGTHEAQIGSGSPVASAAASPHVSGQDASSDSECASAEEGEGAGGGCGERARRAAGEPAAEALQPLLRAACECLDDAAADSLCAALGHGACRGGRRRPRSRWPLTLPRPCRRRAARDAAGLAGRPRRRAAGAQHDWQGAPCAVARAGRQRPRVARRARGRALRRCHGA